MDKKVIHSVFENLVLTQGETIAIETEKQDVSYKALNAKSNQIAHFLKENEIAKADIVACLLNDSLLQLTSLLGIFKSGGVYLPLDTKYKQNHWEELYESIQPKVLFISKENFDFIRKYDNLFDYSIPRIVILSYDIEGEIDFSVYKYSEGSYKICQTEYTRKDTNPDVCINGNDSSYIFFTSGSSGRPKAVLGNHKSLSHYIHWESKELGVTSKDRIGQLISYSFDASLKDIFITLINGATLCMPTEGVKDDVTYLSEWIRDKKITLLHMVPTMFRLLSSNWKNSDIESVTKFPDLNYVLLAGEKLYNKDISHWRSFQGNHTSIINFYGTTESTILSSFYRVKNELEGNPSDVLCVGQPISNTALLVLNSDLELCKINEVGDIYIKTPFLSKGYFGNSVETSQKFIQNPLSNKKDIIYKTGDYGKYDIDRNLIVQGRKDGIVKRNGVRIDINSIESSILELLEVRMIKCMFYEGENLESKLICFYNSESPITEILRAHCVKYLSYYEIPSVFIHLESFPINANGKIDSMALKEHLKIVVPNNNYEEATNETEKKLIKIWEDVLGIDKIGINDDLLVLGGNSLKTILLSSRIRKEFGVTINVKDLFINSILKEQALCIIAQGNLLSKVETGTIEIDTIEIDTIETQDFYPLSPSQYRLWVLSQFDQASLAYNISRYLELEENYDIEIFKKAIIQTIDRHESLRTVFVSDEEGNPRQKVLTNNDFNFSIGYEDFSKEDNKEDSIARYMNKDSKIPFDLENGPLIRASLLKMPNEEYVFYYVIHHIIGDEWSLKVLGRDVHACYNALLNKKEVDLPKLNIQYKDYAVWKIKQDTVQAFKKDKEYWGEKLSGDIPILQLPNATKRPKIKTYSGNTLSTYISVEDSKNFKNFSQERKGSLFIGLLAVWNVLLYRYTGNRDIILGTPVSGRNQIELEDQIGFYVNTLALRNKVNEKDSFNELYDRVKETTLTSYDHQGYPFDALVDDLNLKADSSRSPLFDMMLILQNIDQQETIDENEIFDVNAIQDHGTCFSKFDLEISFKEVEDVVSFVVRYNTDIYDKNTIEMLMKHFKQVLPQLVKFPDLDLDKIDYLNNDEKVELLQGLNNTNTEYSKDQNVLVSFKNQVALNPNSIAIEFNKNYLTYRELDDLSNQFCNYLLLHNTIEKNSLIGVLIEQSEWLMVCILGILKTGAAYVPIDPVYPKNKIEYIKEDSQCITVIDKTVIEHFKNNRKEYAKHYETSKIEATDLAYVIYTSGSTGKPKGVMIEHGSLMNYLNWSTEFYLQEDLANKDFGLFTSLSFDLTVTSLFLPIINGSKLKVFDADLGLSEILKEYMSNEISCIKLTPAHINLLESFEVDISHQQAAIVGGDVLHKNHIDILRKLNPDIRIYNEYGPTEATVGCIVFEVISSEEEILIGTPIANTEIYILNEENQLQPKGITGEICIGGSGLARGYYRREKLNNEKFINHPFKEGKKLYKTGDLGRWLNCGNMQFFGRKDNQVKINGHRIELGEVEYHLQLKDDIKEATTLIREVEGNKELVAYLVRHEDQNIVNLRDYLLDRLPDYMIPSLFIQVDKIPITVNGKIDKVALSKIKGDELFSKALFQLPKNEEEAIILGIWQEILGREEISTKDNFFDLGGNSIKAIKILHKVNQKFLINLTIKNLFGNPTIENLATQVFITKQQQAIVNSGNKLKEIQL